MLIQPYKESWPNDFLAICLVIKNALVDIKISIEHIGSTSIPGLAAKPIIDIDIVYYWPDDFEIIKSRLEKIGYYHNGNQGIPGREVFKRANTTTENKVLDSIAHHLYVCPSHSEELQKHILFRDHLLKDEAARTQYQTMKCEIAEEANQDWKKYAQLKEVKTTAFINSILKMRKIVEK